MCGVCVCVCVWGGGGGGGGGTVWVRSGYDRYSASEIIMTNMGKWITRMQPVCSWWGGGGGGTVWVRSGYDRYSASEIIMTNMGKWITRMQPVCSWWRHYMETFSALLAICAGIHRSPVNSPHKGQWRGAFMFPLICAWVNGWVNNRETSDLRRHGAHYDVIVMYIKHCS